VTDFFLRLSLRAAADGFAAIARGRLRDARGYFEAAAVLAACVYAARQTERLLPPLLVPPSTQGEAEAMGHR